MIKKLVISEQDKIELFKQQITSMSAEIIQKTRRICQLEERLMTHKLLLERCENILGLYIKEQQIISNLREKNNISSAFLNNLLTNDQDSEVGKVMTIFLAPRDLNEDLYEKTFMVGPKLKVKFSRPKNYITTQ